jgi:hypothetical protein
MVLELSELVITQPCMHREIYRGVSGTHSLEAAFAAEGSM